MSYDNSGNEIQEVTDPTNSSIIESSELGMGYVMIPIIFALVVLVGVLVYAHHLPTSTSDFDSGRGETRDSIMASEHVCSLPDDLYQPGASPAIPVPAEPVKPVPTVVPPPTSVPPAQPACQQVIPSPDVVPD